MVRMPRRHFGRGSQNRTLRCSNLADLAASYLSTSAESRDIDSALLLRTFELSSRDVSRA